MSTGSKARVRIDANIGGSPTTSDNAEEIAKLSLAVAWRDDTVMDLSTGKRIVETRTAIIETTTVPIGAVSIYQALERVASADETTAELDAR